jgi:hypothetical protein
VPDEVLETMRRVWEDRIKNSEALKEYAANRGALFTPIYGEEAQEKARPAVAQNAWLLF